MGTGDVFQFGGEGGLEGIEFNLGVGGGVRYNFDWDGWGANEDTFFATCICHFVDLWHFYMCFYASILPHIVFSVIAPININSVHPYV